MAAPEPDIEPTAVPTTPPGGTATADSGAQGSPAADNRSGGGRRSGLSIGGDGGGAPSGIPSDFQFTYYIDRMLSLIESKWYRPPVPPQTQAQVRFVITKSGRLEGVLLESSSGISSFDRAVLRALYASNPLPPLPPAYRKPSLTVHLTFSE
jgi:TonB family protein